MDCGVIAPNAISGGSAPSSAPCSPRNRVKFMCSHGGKILPRPGDGQLKYVGGETRVISVPRDVPFQELMKKLTYLIDGEMVLKYQVVSEDLDALVSVKSDEDLRHMFDEIDLHETAGSPRLRAFLFPANNVVMENQVGPIESPRALDQRYLDSINGIIRSNPFSTKRGGSLVSSTCSSPRSPDSCTNNEFMLQNNGISMLKVQSSPSICSLNNNVPHQNGHYVYQLQPQHYYQGYRQVHHPTGYQSPKPSIDYHRTCAPDQRLVSVKSVGRADGMKYHVDPASQYYYNVSRQNQGNGGCVKCMQHDDSGHFSDKRFIDRNYSFTMRSVPSSPRYGQGEF